MILNIPVHLQQGRQAENYACRYLKKRGFKLLTRNYRTSFGEIDLIMRQDEILIFVEVRYRSNAVHGSPAETIDARKQKRLRACAEHYLQHHKSALGSSCRFDVVAFTGDFRDQNTIWIKDAL